MAYEGVDEEAGAHGGGADHEGFATAAVLDDPEAADGGGDVDGAEDDGGDV